MGYQMKLDEMQEALSNADHPLAAHFERMLTATGDAMAAALAAQFGIDHGSAEQHGIGFAGICCPFYPTFRGQRLPKALEGFDDAEAWDNKRKDLPPKPKGTRSRSARKRRPRSPAQALPPIPADFPVKPLSPGSDGDSDPYGQAVLKRTLATCGDCGRSWDDGIATSYTPAPAGRCPFEAFHGESDR